MKSSMNNYLLFALLFLFTANLSGQENIRASLIHDGETRDFMLHVPTNYQEGDQLPLVINMHGFNSNMGQQRILSEFNPISDAENFLVVYPQGLYRLTAYGPGRHWNSYWGTNVDDVGFISHLIDYLHLTYNVDLSRVYATGMSNGGFMSYHLACELSDRIAAIASVTGTMSHEEIANCQPERTMPVMEIHGTWDLVVPYNGNSAFASSEETVQFWVEHNGCPNPPTKTNVPNTNFIDLSKASYEHYEDCNDDTEVIFYTVKRGGHTWPGSDIPIPALGNTNWDFEASEVIWEFFKKHQHPDPADANVIAVATNSLTQENNTIYSEGNILDSDAIKVFPNPVTNLLQVESYDLDVQRIQLFDAVGQLVWKSTHFDGVIDMSNMAKGFYTLEVVGADGKWLGKVLKK